MNLQMKKLGLILVGSAALACLAAADAILTQGTDVKLAFDQAVSSKTAKAGDRVRLHVADSIGVENQVVIPAGTPVWGVVSTVKHRGRFGKNARLQITLNPVRVHGRTVTLQPRQEGKAFKGSKTDQAAIASGAGAVLLGPIGLVGGYFITGKSVEIHPGDFFWTETARAVRFP